MPDARISCVSSPAFQLGLKNRYGSCWYLCMNTRITRLGSATSTKRRSTCAMYWRVAAVERELEMWEWRKHMGRRPETDLGVEAATLLAEERNLR